MSDTLKSIVFSAILCLVCSLLLTAASSGLKSRQTRNMVIDKQKNILKSVGLLGGGSSMSSEDVERQFNEKIESVWVDRDGNILKEGSEENGLMPLYLHKEKNVLKDYVVPISSRGLWGGIYGYLAIKNDGVTVSGFTIYSHVETPGLGGEIDQSWFQNNFAGKKIVDPSGTFTSVGIAKGSVASVIPKDQQANYVDGISGATLTGNFLSEGIKSTLSEYEPVSVTFRKETSTAKEVQ